MTSPLDHGHLEVGEGQLVYRESCGTPDGIPVLFDQRGAGRSLPTPATSAPIRASTPSLI